MRKRIILLIMSLLLTMPLIAQDDTMLEQEYFYTYHQATGNRFIAGTGTFPDVNAQDIEVGAVPLWILGIGDSWHVMTDDGQIVTIEGDTITRTIQTVPFPLALGSNGNLLSRANLASTLSHAVSVADDYFVDVLNSGELLLYSSGAELDRLSLNIQPDARIVVSDDGRIAVYANATNQRYVHGIMGDDLEGASLVILQIVADKLEIIEQIDLEGDAIYEGLSPMWADVNEDGLQDLITTVSDSQVGSRIRVYLFTENGTLTVEGQAIGQQHRWQHQLAWGAFGANGEMQLVDVLTPHIGGVTRFYEFDGTGLSVVSQTGGYTSHSIHSRNLDMAVAGDFDGDGQLEIVLPSQDRTRIAGITNTENGAQVVWELPLGGTLASNLAAVNTSNGLALAAGRADGVVRIWSR